MGVFHEQSKLRFHSAEVHLGYDGSIRVSTNAQVILPDGTDSEMRHGHTHRVSPHHPHWRYLAEALRPAVRAHHEALGLACPDEALPIHLHPHGHVAFPAVTAPEPGAVSHDELRAHLVRAKESELGVPIPKEAHPRLEPEA